MPPVAQKPFRLPLLVPLKTLVGPGGPALLGKLTPDELALYDAVLPHLQPGDRAALARVVGSAKSAHAAGLARAAPIIGASSPTPPAAPPALEARATSPAPVVEEPVPPARRRPR